MRIRRAVLQVILFIVLGAWCSFAEAQNIVQSVEIHSGWGGLGAPQNLVVRIQRIGGKFLSNGRPVSTTQVQSLVVALSAAPLQKPEMTNLGITYEWLRSELESQRPRTRDQATASQRKLFKKSFIDPNLIANVLPGLFNFTSFDDYPFSKIEVVFDDGSRLSAVSHSYYVFMLPWNVEGRGETYNAEISRAVASLLPAKSVNKDRLAGVELASQLTDAVMTSIEPYWNLLGSDERAGETLNKLRTTYDVVSAEITHYHHPEYGTEGKPEEMNLHVAVRRPNFPSNISDALVLRYANRKVLGVDEFLTLAGKYEGLALSVPWLNDYIRDNSQVTVRISYVHDKSFGDKAMRVFAADMKLRGREDLVEQVKSQQGDIVLLIIGNTYAESYWLLFPDKHMMLWRYAGPSGLLKWTREDFHKGQCSEYEDNYGGCSGREITADGTLAPEHTPQDQDCMAKSRASRRDGIATGDDLFPVMNRGRSGFINGTGRVVIPLCFDKVGDFSEGLARFERDGNWGFIDTQGSVVIEPKFPWAEEFSEGLAKVQISGSSLGVDGRWGFIDKTGKVVIPPDYTEGGGEKSNIGSDGREDSFHDGLAKVEVNGKIGYIDKTGRLAIPAAFAYADPFVDGLAAVTNSRSGDGGWGYIDTHGSWVVAPEFEWGSSFHEGLAAVNRTKNCGYIDKTGKMVLQPPISPQEKDCATVWGNFSEGLSRWKVGDKYGFIDRNGKIVIGPKYDLAFNFSEGLAAVRIDGKWGYIDKSGKMVIALQKLFNADEFHHGLAFVTTESREYGYIDKSGKYVWTPTFLYADTR